jgi:hypothetical protein
MSIGMLWFDNDPKATLEEKVRRAAKYYREKYGKKPNMCFVSKKENLEGELVVDGITVRQSPSIMAHSYWIGVDDTKGLGHED